LAELVSGSKCETDEGWSIFFSFVRLRPVSWLGTFSHIRNRWRSGQPSAKAPFTIEKRGGISFIRQPDRDLAAALESRMPQHNGSRGRTSFGGRASCRNSCKMLEFAHGSRVRHPARTKTGFAIEECLRADDAFAIGCKFSDSGLPARHLLDATASATMERRE
jgi:hypothetical protein